MRPFAEDLAERTTAGLAGKQAKHMANDMFEQSALCQLRFDIGAHCAQQFATAAQPAAEPFNVEAMQQIRIVVGRAPQHRAVSVRKMRDGRVQRRNAAIDDHL